MAEQTRKREGKDKPMTQEYWDSLQRPAHLKWIKEHPELLQHLKYELNPKRDGFHEPEKGGYERVQEILNNRESTKKYDSDDEDIKKTPEEHIKHAYKLSTAKDSQYKIIHNLKSYMVRNFFNKEYSIDNLSNFGIKDLTEDEIIEYYLWEIEQHAKGKKLSFGDSKKKGDEILSRRNITKDDKVISKPKQKEDKLTTYRLDMLKVIDGLKQGKTEEGQELALVDYIVNTIRKHKASFESFSEITKGLDIKERIVYYVWYIGNCYPSHKVADDKSKEKINTIIANRTKPSTVNPTRPLTESVNEFMIVYKDNKKKIIEMMEELMLSTLYKDKPIEYIRQGVSSLSSGETMTYYTWLIKQGENKPDGKTKASKVLEIIDSRKGQKKDSTVLTPANRNGAYISEFAKGGKFTKEEKNDFVNLTLKKDGKAKKYTASGDYTQEYYDTLTDEQKKELYTNEPDKLKHLNGVIKYDKERAAEKKTEQAMVKDIEQSTKTKEEKEEVCNTIVRNLINRLKKLNEETAKEPMTYDTWRLKQAKYMISTVYPYEEDSGLALFILSYEQDMKRVFTTLSEHDKLRKAIEVWNKNLPSQRLFRKGGRLYNEYIKNGVQNYNLVDFKTIIKLTKQEEKSFKEQDTNEYNRQKEGFEVYYNLFYLSYKNNNTRMTNEEVRSNLLNRWWKEDRKYQFFFCKGGDIYNDYETKKLNTLDILKPNKYFRTFDTVDSQLEEEVRRTSYNRNKSNTIQKPLNDISDKVVEPVKALSSLQRKLEAQASKSIVVKQEELKQKKGKPLAWNEIKRLQELKDTKTKLTLIGNELNELKKLESRPNDINMFASSEIVIGDKHKYYTQPYYNLLPQIEKNKLNKTEMDACRYLIITRENKDKTLEKVDRSSEASLEIEAWKDRLANKKTTTISTDKAKKELKTDTSYHSDSDKDEPQKKMPPNVQALVDRLKSIEQRESMDKANGIKEIAMNLTAIKAQTAKEKGNNDKIKELLAKIKSPRQLDTKEKASPKSMRTVIQQHPKQEDNSPITKIELNPKLVGWIERYDANILSSIKTNIIFQLRENGVEVDGDLFDSVIRQATKEASANRNKLLKEVDHLFITRMTDPIPMNSKTSKVLTPKQFPQSRNVDEEEGIRVYDFKNIQLKYQKGLQYVLRMKNSNWSLETFFNDNTKFTTELNDNIVELIEDFDSKEDDQSKINHDELQKWHLKLLELDERAGKDIDVKSLKISKEGETTIIIIPQEFTHENADKVINMITPFGAQRKANRKYGLEGISPYQIFENLQEIQEGRAKFDSTMIFKPINPEATMFLADKLHGLQSIEGDIFLNIEAGTGGILKELIATNIPKASIAYTEPNPNLRYILNSIVSSDESLFDDYKDSLNMDNVGVVIGILQPSKKIDVFVNRFFIDVSKFNKKLHILFIMPLSTNELFRKYPELLRIFGNIKKNGKVEYQTPLSFNVFMFEDRPTTCSFIYVRYVPENEVDSDEETKSVTSDKPIPEDENSEIDDVDVSQSMLNELN